MFGTPRRRQLRARKTTALSRTHASCAARVDLLNVFDMFLPQLLLYPNPADPLNGEAAALMMREPERYKERIRGAPLFIPRGPTLDTSRQPPPRARAEYVAKFGQVAPAKADDDDDDDDEMSDEEG